MDKIRYLVDRLRPCVYIIECKCPNKISNIEQPHEGPMVRVGEGLTSKRLFYVGSSIRIIERLYEHNRGLTGAAKFTQQYRPIELVELRWYNSKEQAREQESIVAEEYRENGNGSWHVYQHHNQYQDFNWRD
ncbi:GIY-YIG nuclease family protein [Halopelagius longus]|uniref:GIY-YIG nuclease family protein n=2 Tax=Halopelagius longus TaxID=1236180 RepID=A0A370IK62_9EURY|nr:GIY-YIG nuclease family protein [Halopelagius longus]